MLEFDSSSCSCCWSLTSLWASPDQVRLEFADVGDAGARGEAQQARLLRSGASKKYLLARLHRSQVEWEDRVLVPSHFYANIFPVDPGCTARRSMTPVFRSLTSCASGTPWALLGAYGPPFGFVCWYAGCTTMTSAKGNHIAWRWPDDEEWTWCGDKYRKKDPRKPPQEPRPARSMPTVPPAPPKTAIDMTSGPPLALRKE